ncbi:protein rad9 [Rhizophagus clarus]|uniref:Protein rad9 n=1 Tax=Rhizophagus clarus TaxID=94130 RepID=A0A8H3M9R4_9GLOM|nr:protein rad9 [Rhizophagus clarus]
MERFKCNGIIKISVDNLNNMASISMKHDFLHKRPANVEVSQDIKDFIKEHIDLLHREIYVQLVSKGLDSFIHQKQIHFWCQKWLNQENHNIILDETIPVPAIAFTTGLYEKLNQIGVKIRECGIDATYNTNNFGFELYTLEAEINRTGFLLAYLFLENNGRCGDGIPRFTWKGIKIQLCKWHIKRAILNYTTNKFCPKEYHKTIWSIMEKHLQHTLIPTSNGLYLTSKEIYEAAIQEIIVKKDGPYGQGLPRLDLVVYIVNKCSSTSTTKLEQIQSGREKLEWIKQNGKRPVKQEFFERLKRNHEPPFLTEIDKDSAHPYINQTLSNLNLKII